MKKVSFIIALIYVLFTFSSCANSATDDLKDSTEAVSESDISCNTEIYQNLNDSNIELINNKNNDCSEDADDNKNTNNENKIDDQKNDVIDNQNDNKNDSDNNNGNNGNNKNDDNNKNNENDNNDSKDNNNSEDSGNLTKDTADTVKSFNENNSKEFFVEVYNAQWEYWNQTDIFNYQLTLQWYKSNCDVTSGTKSIDCNYKFKMYYKPVGANEYKMINCPVESCYVYDLENPDSEVIYKMQTYKGGWKNYAIGQKYEIIVEVLYKDQSVGWGRTYVTFDKSDAEDLQKYIKYQTGEDIKIEDTGAEISESTPWKADKEISVNVASEKWRFCESPDEFQLGFVWNKSELDATTGYGTNDYDFICNLYIFNGEFDGKRDYINIFSEKASNIYIDNKTGDVTYFYKFPLMWDNTVIGDNAEFVVEITDGHYPIAYGKCNAVFDENDYESLAKYSEHLYGRNVFYVE